MSVRHIVDKDAVNLTSLIQKLFQIGSTLLSTRWKAITIDLSTMVSLYEIIDCYENFFSLASSIISHMYIYIERERENTYHFLHPTIHHFRELPVSGSRASPPIVNAEYRRHLCTYFTIPEFARTSPLTVSNSTSWWVYRELHHKYTNRTPDLNLRRSHTVPNEQHAAHQM